MSQTKAKTVQVAGGGVIVTLSYLIGTLVFSVQQFRLSLFFGEGSSQIAMYVMGYLVQAGGLAFYMLAYRRRPSLWGGRNIYLAFCLIFIVSIAGVYLFDSGGGVLLFSILFNATAALGQGYYFVLLAATLDSRERIFVYAASYSIASILGSALTRVGGGTFLFRPATILLFALLIVFVSFSVLRVRPPAPEHESASSGGGPPQLGLIVSIVVVMWVLHGIGDASVAMQYSADMSYLFRRGMYAVGLTGAAFLFLKSRRAGMILTVLSLLYPLVVPALREDSLMAVLEYSLLWIFTGILSVYRFVVFADMAGEDRRFLYLAPMGLFLERLTMGVYIGFSTLFQPSELVNVVVTVSMFMALLLLFLRLLRLKAAAAALSSEDFAKRYGLTRREAEVFDIILKSDANPKELAAELFISERMLYRHLNSIYEKTGTSSRIGLLLLFYGTGEKTGV